jgi:hypothetical protein
MTKDLNGSRRAALHLRPVDTHYYRSTRPGVNCFALLGITVYIGCPVSPRSSGAYHGRRQTLLQVTVSSLVLDFFPRTSRCSATLFVSSIVKRYGIVATLTWQLVSRGCPGFVHFVFPILSVFPPLPSGSPIRCHLNLAT